MAIKSDLYRCELRVTYNKRARIVDEDEARLGRDMDRPVNGSALVFFGYLFASSFNYREVMGANKKQQQ